MNKAPRDDELAFVAGLTNSEIARLRALLGARSTGAGATELAQAQAALIEEIGRLSARLMVVEHAIEQQLLGPAIDDGVPVAPSVGLSRLDINALHDWRSFHDIETDAAGRRYAWTSGRAFKASLDAGGDPGLRFIQVFFIAIVRSSYARRAEIIANGQRLKHVVSAVDGELCLEARMPRSMGGGAVELEVRLPASHMLTPPGEQHRDWRDGGIAVTAVALARHARASWLKRVLK